MRQEEGYVTLLAVLITGAVALSVGVTLLMTGVNGLMMSQYYEQEVLARANARTCAEAGLYQIHEDINYQGTGADSGCTYAVVNQGGGTYRIDAVGTRGEVTRKLVVYASLSGTTLSVTSWKDAL